MKKEHIPRKERGETSSIFSSTFPSTYPSVNNEKKQWYKIEFYTTEPDKVDISKCEYIDDFKVKISLYRHIIYRIFGV
jgi:hypothetical protein